MQTKRKRMPQWLSKRIRNPHLKEIFKGASIALMMKLSGAVIHFLFMIAVSRLYGPKGTGFYGMSVTIILILTTVGSLGFGSSVVRFVSQFSVRKQLAEIRALYKNVLQIFLPFSVLLSLLLFLFKAPLAKDLFHDQRFIPAFKIIAFTIPFAILYRINIEFIRGFKNIALSEYIRHVNRNLMNILFLLMLHFFFRHHYLPTLSYALAILTSAAVGTFFVFRYLRNIPHAHENILSKKELLKTSTPMMMTSIINLFNHHIDMVMLGILSTTANVGIYAICIKLAEITALTVMAVNRIAMPKFSELYWSGNMEALKKSILFSSKIRFWAGAPVLILFVLAPEFFLGLFGKEFTMGKNALILLSIGQLINAASGSCASLLNMIGKERVIRNIILIATLINIGLNLYLIPRYGVTGAAAATMSATIFWNSAAVLYIQWIMKIKILYIPLFSTVRKKIFPTI